jgi:hypothetical protein
MVTPGRAKLSSIPVTTFSSRTADHLLYLLY